MPMTNIFFLMVRVYRNQFKCDYLRNRKTFPDFFAQFKKYSSNFEYFETKDDPHSICISENTFIISSHDYERGRVGKCLS